MDYKTELIKNEIENQYRSVREFAIRVGIPYTTLKSALEKGIGGTAVDTVIKICDELEIDINKLKPSTKGTVRKDLTLRQLLLLSAFHELNEAGQNEAIKRLEELAYIDKYRGKAKPSFSFYEEVKLPPKAEPEEEKEFMHGMSKEEYRKWLLTEFKKIDTDIEK